MSACGPSAPLGPVRNKARKNMEFQFHTVYSTILETVRAGSSITQACKAAGVARTTFYKWRYAAELKIVDIQCYDNLRECLQDNNQLVAECKSLLVDERYGEKIKKLKQRGDLLRN